MKNIKTIKKIRFISAINTLLAYFITNNKNIYANDVESYMHTTTIVRIASFALLIVLLFNIVVFLVSSIYILREE